MMNGKSTLSLQDSNVLKNCYLDKVKIYFFIIKFFKGSPGFVYTGFAKTSHTSSQKPFILVAGDGDYKAWILIPDDKEDFKYSQELIQDVKGTVGTILIKDVDGDGYNEVFIPYFEGGLIYVWTFAP